jgi:hypothetical protein
LKQVSLISLVTIGLLITACASGPNVKTEPALQTEEKKTVEVKSIDDLPFAFLTVVNEGGSPPFQCPVSGTLTSIETDELGMQKAVIHLTQNYYLAGELKALDYQLVIGGLDRISAPLGPIADGDQLGYLAEGKNAYISAVTEQLEDYVLRCSNREPVFYQNAWWAAPHWLMPNQTQWLSYRQVDSLEAAVRDFYQRWASERAEAGEDTNNINSYGEIHFFPNLDRVRVLTSIQEPPEPALRTRTLAMTELNIYRQAGLFPLQNRFSFEGMDYDTVVYWQKGFDQYLADDYSWGEPLYLYCNVMALDHENKVIVVLARDFISYPDEEIIAKRRNYILNK